MPVTLDHYWTTVSCYDFGNLVLFWKLSVEFPLYNYHTTPETATQVVSFLLSTVDSCLAWDVGVGKLLVCQCPQKNELFFMPRSVL